MVWDACFDSQVVSPQRVHAQGKLMLRGYENGNWEYVQVEDALGHSSSMSAALVGISRQAVIQDNGELQIACSSQLALKFRLPCKAGLAGTCNGLQLS